MNEPKTIDEIVEKYTGELLTYIQSQKARAETISDNSILIKMATDLVAKFRNCFRAATEEATATLKKTAQAEAEFAEDMKKQNVKLTAENEQLLDALKMAYRKHHLSDDSIGWEELGNKLLDALCESMTDEGYHDWLRSITARPGKEE